MDTVYFENEMGRKFEVPLGRTWLYMDVEGDVAFLKQSSNESHALVRRDGQSVWIVAIAGGTGSLHVNGEAIEPHRETPLLDGDQVRLPGRIDVITVRYGPVGAGETVTETELPQGDETPLPSRSFGFAVENVELAWQGVDANAAKHLVERYRPIQVISSGGMGKVILVQEIMSGRFVALKIMLEAAMHQESLVQQFVREAVITARLQHPHIIPVHDLGFFNDRHLYYTMSYIEGDSFGKFARNVDLAERLRVLRSAALAVSFAHSKGLWHRDLKPSNILVGPLGYAYVIDWGLVTIQPGREYRLNIPRIIIERFHYLVPDRLLEETPDAITTGGGPGAERLGTPAYMSPEQIENTHEMGVVSDVWAFGIMLFEAITGQHPLIDIITRGSDEIMSAIRLKVFPRPSDLLGDAPRELDDLCRRMLDKKPQNRVKNLDVFLLELTEYIRLLGQPVTSFGSQRFPAPADANACASEESQTRPDSTRLYVENQRLLSELERSRLKNEILAELAQLNWFERSRRRKLWSELARL